MHLIIIIILKVINVVLCSCFILSQGRNTHLIKGNLSDGEFNSVNSKIITNRNYPTFIKDNYILLSFKFHNPVSILPNDKEYIKSQLCKPIRLSLSNRGNIMSNESNIRFLNWIFYPSDRSIHITFDIPLLKLNCIIKSSQYYGFHTLKGMVEADVYIIYKDRPYIIGSIYITRSKNKYYYSSYPFPCYLSYFCNARLVNELKNVIFRRKKRLSKYNIRLNKIPEIYNKLPSNQTSKYNKLVSITMDNVNELPLMRPMRVMLYRRSIESNNMTIPALYYKDLKTGRVEPDIYSLYNGLSVCLSMQNSKRINDFIRVYNCIY